MRQAEARLGEHTAVAVARLDRVAAAVKHGGAWRALHGEGGTPDYAPYADFYDAFDADDRFVIRNGARDAADVAMEIRAGLAEGRFRVR
jgi:hypothetical protein